VWEGEGEIKACPPAVSGDFKYHAPITRQLTHKHTQNRGVLGSAALMGVKIKDDAS
jgi:hypothetical protein